MGTDELLDRWREAGLLTASQAEAIRAYEARTGQRATPPPEEPEVHGTGSKPASKPAQFAAIGSNPAEPRVGLGIQVPEVDLRTLGTVLAALALIALLANMFAVTTDLFLGPGQRVATEAEDALHLVASVLGLVGGLRLASGRASGRGLVYWSLGINLAATLLLAGRGLTQPLTIGAVLVWIALAVLTWRAEYRGRPGPVRTSTPRSAP